MMKKSPVPSYKEGQFICMQLPSKKGGIPDQWYFGKISKVVMEGTAADAYVEAYTYDVPEVPKKADMEKQWESLYPSVSLTREAIMLARLAAKILPQEQDRSGHFAVQVKLRNICEAKFDHFRERLIGVR